MWIPIAPFDEKTRYLKTPIEVAASISVTEMKLQDELVDYGDSSKHQENIFDFKINHYRPWPFEINFH